MNLKLLSTSAALALSSIVKTGGAESKAVLADKIAASYEKHLDTHDRYPRKRILDHARNLQAHLRKDADDPAAGRATESQLQTLSRVRQLRASVQMLASSASIMQ
ncbi:hypothetical protein QTG54_011252 [Skeletonema marinoi]|uniref:Uncharacterized protein n=1 Tax=Skeletonema marinoi TaxID=267567 RepID=A0AAD8Y2G5_9STRA|nr:hypothetical protein QTG54_011252 [Skeletonema marinoi]